ncbi:hypothetical protein [Halovivax limisalsi]|uniref:hypothetical protein n=1 Tax=Halovivax limisalsi TaxID=1453760 RepID=UPI001FFC4115|nr:hypothetical protein [Halovivax limisalsi]
MATEGDDASSGPGPQYGSKAAFILVLAIFFGFFVAVFVTNDLGPILQWFWIGIAVTVVYLLAALANAVERLRQGS